MDKIQKFGKIVFAAYIVLPISAFMLLFGGLSTPGSSTYSSESPRNLPYILLFICIISALIVVFSILASYCFIFVRMKRKWWEAIIPIYNSFILHKGIYGNGWWFLFPILAAIPIIGWILSLIYIITFFIRFAYSFNKSIGFALGLLLLNPIFVLLLAYGSAEYNPLTNFHLGHPFTFVHENEVENNFSSPVQYSSSINSENVAFCPNCGNKLNSGAAFCPKCGTKVN